MKLYIDVCEGEVIPKGYGIAWRYYDRLLIRCYPIPLNLIIRKWKDFYCRLRVGWWDSKWEIELLKAYWKGAEDNRKGKK